MRFRDQIFAALFCLALPALLGSETARGDDDAAVSAAVAKDIALLSHDDFQVREAATQRLKGAGQPAIAPLAEAALQGELETTNRAAQILISFYDRLTDLDALDELDTALEKLADSKSAPAARRAAGAIAAQADNRSARALAQLLKMKAMVDSPLQARLGFGQRGAQALGQAGPLTIWIDDQWQGGDEELRYFRRLKHLQALYRVEGCGASLDAVRKLSQIIPGVVIQERGAACLGLGAGDNRERGFEIGQVELGGSIGAAGLRAGDIIVQYDGQEINNFEQLVEMIKESKPGQSVPVTYLRQGQPVTVDVQLKSWREVFVARSKHRAAAARPGRGRRAPQPIPAPQPRNPPEQEEPQPE